MSFTLEQWLVVATLGLARAEHERIRAEITAHVDDAIQTHVAAGRRLEQATQNAILELGDPEEANHAFRRTHLTEKEAERLEKMLSEPRRPVLTFFCVVWGLASIFLYSSWGGLGMLLLGLDPLVRGLLARRQPYSHLSLLVSPILAFGYGTFILIGDGVPNRGFAAVCGTALLILTTYWWFSTWRLYQKLVSRR